MGDSGAQALVVGGQWCSVVGRWGEGVIRIKRLRGCGDQGLGVGREW